MQEPNAPLYFNFATDVVDRWAATRPQSLALWHVHAATRAEHKLTFRQIREGRSLDFDSCMRMEYRLTNRVLAGHDFYEGVRVTLIDKGERPNWQPPTLEAVSDAAIAPFFVTLGDQELVVSGQFGTEPPRPR